jgi:hypothetical protein
MDAVSYKNKSNISKTTGKEIFAQRTLVEEGMLPSASEIRLRQNKRWIIVQAILEMNSNTKSIFAFSRKAKTKKIALQLCIYTESKRSSIYEIYSK